MPRGGRGAVWGRQRGYSRQPEDAAEPPTAVDEATEGGRRRLRLEVPREGRETWREGGGRGCCWVGPPRPLHGQLLHPHARRGEPCEGGAGAPIRRRGQGNKGPFINDVTQNLRVFGPPPPLVTHLGLIHSTKSTQPPLLHHVLDNPLPPSHA